MNVDKTNIMIFLKTKANNICVKLNDLTVTKVQYCRYLGIFLDDALTWSHHIDTVYSKLMKYVGIFYKIRSKLLIETSTIDVSFRTRKSPINLRSYRDAPRGSLRSPKALVLLGVITRRKFVQLFSLVARVSLNWRIEMLLVTRIRLYVRREFRPPKIRTSFSV